MNEISLRERKKQRTRESLAEHALRLFQEQGFDATTVEEIAEAAGVSRRTFFRYFGSKEAAVFTQRADLFGLFKQVLNERSKQEDSFSTVRRACLSLAAIYMEERDQAVEHDRLVEATPSLIAYERQLDREWENEVASTLLEGRRGARARHHARVIAGAVFGVIRAVLRDWFDRDAKPDLMRLGSEALDLLENGIGPR